MKVTWALLPLLLARMRLVPLEIHFNRPLVLTVILLLPFEFQLTWVVMSKVVPSLNVPVAVSCKVPLTGTVVPPLALVMAMLVSVALVTVSVAVPVLPDRLALMVLVPAATAVAKPLVLVALLMVATVVVPEVQVTWLVTVAVEPSL